MEHFLLLIFHFFERLGLSGIFLSMLIENIGIPLPTEIGYLIGQHQIVTREHSYLLIMLILTLGHLTGALISYRIGLAADSLIVKKLKKNKKIIETQKKLENWYKKYGDWTIFITRFIGYVRPWSSYVAGFAKVDFWPFVIWTTLGSVIFNVMTLYFSNMIYLIWRKFVFLHLALIIATLVLFFGFISCNIGKILFAKK